MEFSVVLFAVFLQVLVFFSAFMATNSHVPLEESTNSKSFSNNFLFGTASSAYQVTLFFLLPFLFCFLLLHKYLLLQFEGAFLSDGKGLNNWDVFTHKPG